MLRNALSQLYESNDDVKTDAMLMPKITSIINKIRLIDSPIMPVMSPALRMLSVQPFCAALMLKIIAKIPAAKGMTLSWHIIIEQMPSTSDAIENPGSAFCGRGGFAP